MGIRHKAASSPDQQPRMRYAFNRLTGVALGQIAPHVWGDGVFGQGQVSALIPLLESAFEDPDGVATTERKMRVIKQNNREFPQDHVEFQVITTDLDWNPAVSPNALWMGLSEELKDSFTYSDMPEELPRFWTVYKTRDNQILQLRAETAPHNTGGGTGFVSSSRSLAPPTDPAGAPAGTVAGYTGPAPMDLSVGRREISAEERAKTFMDRRCLYCGGFNHRVAECVTRKKAQTFKAAGAEVTEVGTGTGPKESVID